MVALFGKMMNVHINHGKSHTHKYGNEILLVMNKYLKKA